MVVSKHHCAIIGSNKSAGLELQAMLSRTKTNDSRVDRVNPRNNNSSPSTDGRQKTHNPHTLSLQYNFVFYELTSTAIGVDEQAEDLAEELEAFKVWSIQQCLRGWWNSVYVLGWLMLISDSQWW